MSSHVIGRVSALLFAACLAVSVFASSASARFGERDPDFNGDGRVTVRPGAGDDSNLAVARQPDGRVVAVGYATVPGLGGHRDLAVTRVTADGEPDPTFSDDGLVTLNVGSPETDLGEPTDDVATSVIVDSQGRLLVAGMTHTQAPGGGGQNIVVARFRPDGTLDNTFNLLGARPGVVTLRRSGGASDFATDVAELSDGRIVVGARVGLGGAEAYDVHWLGANGSPLAQREAPVAPRDSGDFSTDLAVTPDDGVLVAGYGTETLGLTVARYGPDTLLDVQFGGGGSVQVFGVADDTVRGLLVGADGRFVLAAHSPTQGFLLHRWTAEGVPDPGFTPTRGGTGPGLGDPAYYSVLADEDLIIVGAHTKYADGTYDFSVVRYLPDGSLDKSFGGGEGRVIASAGNESGGNINNDLAMQPDRKLLFAGFSRDAFAGDKDLLISRFRPYTDPETDPTNPGNVSTADPTCANPTIRAIAPTSATAGDRVVITGTGFGRGGSVSFGGAAGEVMSWSATRVTVLVPHNAKPPVVVSCGGPDETISTAVDVAGPESTFEVVGPGNLPPTAAAYALTGKAKRKHKRVLARVSLDGRLSSDPEGERLRYRWTLLKASKKSTRGRKAGSRKTSRGRVIGKRATLERFFAAGRVARVRLVVTDPHGARDATTLAVKPRALPRPTKPSKKNPDKGKPRKGKPSKPVRPRPAAPVKLRLPADVLFDFDSSTVTPAGRKALARLRPLAARARGVVLVGNCDWLGDDAYNKALGLRRAQAARAVLLSGRRGHKSERPQRRTVVVRSNGEAKPVASNETAAGRSKNRNVMVLIKP